MGNDLVKKKLIFTPEYLPFALDRHCSVRPS